MNADLVCYVAQFLAAVVFALVCEFLFRRRYEPSYTWVPAMVGIGQVGLIAAARLALAPVPHLVGAEMAWWTWWLIFWGFVASSIPIIVWQVIVQEWRVRRLLAFTSRQDGA
jgi:hypothetical protein